MNTLSVSFLTPFLYIPWSWDQIYSCRTWTLESNTQWQPLAFVQDNMSSAYSSLSTLLYGWAWEVFTHIRRFKYMAHHVVYCAVLYQYSHGPELTGAINILGVQYTELHKEIFFGSFVNPNHAGPFWRCASTFLSMRKQKYLLHRILGLSLYPHKVVCVLAVY